MEFSIGACRIVMEDSEHKITHLGKIKSQAPQTRISFQFREKVIFFNDFGLLFTTRIRRKNVTKTRGQLSWPP